MPKQSLFVVDGMIEEIFPRRNPLSCFDLSSCQQAIEGGALHTAHSHSILSPLTDIFSVLLFEIDVSGLRECESRKR